MHNKVRLNHDNKMICIKGIASACYALQNKTNHNKIDNLIDLQAQFTSIDQYGLMDLDFLEKYLVKWERKKIKNFDNKKNWKTIYFFTRFFDISAEIFSKEFTDALFQDLKITRAEKKTVKRI